MVGTSASGFGKFVAVLFASAATPYLMAMTNILYGPTATARSALLQQEFTDPQRATMASVISLFGSVLFGCSSTALGYIADLSSPATAILIALTANVLLVHIYARTFANGAAPPEAM